MLLILLFEKMKVNNPPLSNLFLGFSLFLPLSYLSESSRQLPNKTLFVLSLAKSPPEEHPKPFPLADTVNMWMWWFQKPALLSWLCWSLCRLSQGRLHHCSVGVWALLQCLCVCDDLCLSLWALGVSQLPWLLSVLLHSVSSLPTGLWE